MGMNLCHYIDTHQSLFQPTPLQWGELPFAVACVGNPKFQPTSPYGDEPTGITEIFNLFHFNPHPRMGMNINSTYLKKREWRLQPTPPYRDELLDKSLDTLLYHYNPHPRMGMN